jgi:hypothetical protein
MPAAAPTVESRQFEPQVQQRPFVGQNRRTGDKPDESQQLAAAQQIKDQMRVKYRGDLPPSGSQDEAILAQAEEFLQRAGKVRNPAKALREPVPYRLIYK